MKSKDNWYMIAAVFLLAVLLLAPYYAGLYPALFTIDTSFYITTFREGTGFCTAPAVESRLYRCFVQAMYLAEPSYALYSGVKVIFFSLVTVYFSQVLAKIDGRLRFFAVLPLLHPYLGMYVMLDERDVLFDLLLSLLFIRLLDLNLSKAGEIKKLLSAAAIMIVMVLIRDDGVLQSGVVLLFITWPIKSRIRLKWTLLGAALAITGMFGHKVLHSHKLRYSLMVPAIILANTFPEKVSSEDLKILQGAYQKSKFTDPLLRLAEPGSIERATKIMFDNSEIPHPSTSAIEFNGAAARLILEEPLNFLKIRAAVFEKTVYNRLFDLGNYPDRISFFSKLTHGSEFFEFHIKPHLPKNSLFQVLAELDSWMAGAAVKNAAFALIFTPLLGLAVAMSALLNLKSAPVSAAAGVCFLLRALMTFFLAPDANAKYLYSLLIAGLFILVVTFAELYAARTFRARPMPSQD